MSRGGGIIMDDTTHMLEPGLSSTSTPIESQENPQMTDVYYSSIYSNFSVYAKVHTSFNPDITKGEYDSNRLQLASEAEIYKRNKTGQKLSLAELPQQFYGNRDKKKIEKLPEAFFANGYIVVQQKCADVFVRFDLGATDLVPAKVFQKDRKTEVLGSFYVFNFGCTKQSFLPEQSTGIKEAIQTKDGPLWLEPLTKEDGQLALSPLALAGPDLWFEKGMPSVPFVSGRLREALQSEKLDGPFKFFRCRVVGE
jgi:hypothetical protein